ncbi:protocadherin Fat 3-like [Mercenaria mercenaria]|uniref:protocadherin Fat 3-like n=1 Tax=Mercenaria mercenaria TaxID=6596 RepID=UPI00234E61DD|nr:protocadherin Fat 3-like [Mercenaria mercenaria]
MRTFQLLSVEEVLMYHIRDPVINNLPDSRTLSIDTFGVGDNVFTVDATDADNDQITLSITCSPVTPTCPFDIFNSGDIQLNADISGTTVPGYDVTVSVSDSSGSNGISKVLTVTFSGINSQPTIQNLGVTLTVPENNALGDTLETTACTDPDATDTLGFSMACTPSSGLTYFEIDASSGAISTSSSLLNYEFLFAAGTTSFSCTVTCSDGQASDTATIGFDVTDVNEAPMFSQNGYSISADEGAAGTPLQSSGYDIIEEDNSDTKTFSIDCGTSTGYFSIDTTSGILSFGSNYDVDDGVRPTSVSCTVTVTDSGGLTDAVTLSITINNINDNSPVFFPAVYSWFISEGASIGTTVGTVTATDADIGTYGDISYSLDQSTLGASYFGIDQTGKVYIQTSVAPLGGGVTVTFSVVATDGGGTETRVNATVVTVVTTTTTTTTTTDRFKTFFDDGRNIVWFTACCIVIAITIIVLVWMCCSYCGTDDPKPRQRKFNFKCCKWLRVTTKPQVKFEEPKETEVVTIEEPPPQPPPEIVDKPKPEPEGFDFWASSANQWS